MSTCGNDTTVAGIPVWKVLFYNDSSCCFSVDAPNMAGAGDFPDILQGFFNFPGQEQNAGPQRGDDVFVPLSVTLEEMYNGAEINYVRRKLVPETAPGTRKCNCQIVMKQVQQRMMIQMVQEEVVNQL